MDSSQYKMLFVYEDRCLSSSFFLSIYLMLRAYLFGLGWSVIGFLTLLFAFYFSKFVGKYIA